MKTFKAEWWRFAIMLAIFVVKVLFFEYIFIKVLPTIIDNRSQLGMMLKGLEPYEEYSAIMHVAIVSIAMLVTLIVCFPIVHKGKIMLLVNSIGNIRWRKIVAAIAVGSLLYVIVYAINLAILGESSTIERFQDNQGQYLVFSIVVSIVAALAYGLVFNGYFSLSTFSYGRADSVILASIFYTVFFARFLDLPILNVYISLLFLSMLHSIICTLDNGIETSVGMNFSTILFSLINGSDESAFLRVLQTTAVSHIQFYADVILIAVVLLVSLFVFTKLYHWDWRKLFRKIERPVLAAEEE